MHVSRSGAICASSSSTTSTVDSILIPARTRASFAAGRVPGGGGGGQSTDITIFVV